MINGNGATLTFDTDSVTIAYAALCNSFKQYKPFTNEN